MTKNLNEIPNKGTNVQNNLRLYKRKLADKQTFLVDLSEKELHKFFNIFYLAEKSFSKTMRDFPPQSRGRGFEASFFNSCLIKEFQKQFPNDCKFLKFKRFALIYKGYTFLFKKLDKKGYPMNIKTNSNQGIINQMQLCLFDTKEYQNPIIFFGYQQDNSGRLCNPHFVYIDEEKVKWRLIEEEVASTKLTTIGMPTTSEKELHLPKVKENKKTKKKAV